jgi:sugar phosphate isomerase/epimerase
METIISVSTAIYDGYDMDTALERLAEAGVSYVEPAFIKGYMGEFTEADFAESKADVLRHRLNELGLSCLAMSSHIDLGAGDAVDVFKGRMNFAKGIGARLIISNTSKQPSKLKFYRNIEILAAFAAEIGLVIAIENPGHGEDDLFSNGSDAKVLLKEIGSEFIRINYDAGNIHTYNHGRVDIPSDLEAVLPMVVQLHLKDIADYDSGWRFCGIGKGLIDWPTIIALVKKHSPGLPLALEMPLRLQRPRYADPTRIPDRIPLDVIERELKDSLAYVQDLLNMSA